MEKTSYLLNDMKNFNVISRKDVTYENIKSHKIPGLHRLSRRYIFGITTGGQIDTPIHLRVNLNLENGCSLENFTKEAINCFVFRPSCT